MGKAFYCQTLHLLLHSSVVPVKRTFSGDSYIFQTALKMNMTVPCSGRSKTIKSHPAAWLSSNVLYHTMD